MRKHVAAWPERVWTVEGCNGTGRPLARRLLADGEHVVDVPAKLSARARLFGTGHNRKTDAHDADTRSRLSRSAPEPCGCWLKMASSRRCGWWSNAVESWLVSGPDRQPAQRLLSELIPGVAKKDITALQAKAFLASVRPRDAAGQTRRRIAAEHLADLVALDKKIKTSTKVVKAMVAARASTLMELPGIGPVVAPRVLVDVGDVTRFADRNRFASWAGTAPLDASSGGQFRHRLSRAGNRKVNHMLHIAAATQVRLDTPAAPTSDASSPPAKPDPKPCAASNDGSPTPSIASSSPTLAQPPRLLPPSRLMRVREGAARRLKNPARSTCPRTSTLRISHVPDPRNRRYNRQSLPGRVDREERLPPLVDNRGEPERCEHDRGQTPSSLASPRSSCVTPDWSFHQLPSRGSRNLADDLRRTAQIRLGQDEGPPRTEGPDTLATATVLSTLRLRWDGSV
jgi:hypothetical protein